jgi:hypothetical protein
LRVELDPFMLRRIGTRHPEWSRELADQIAALRFTKVVTLRRLVENRDWYTGVHFGEPIYSALLAHYRLVAQADGYYVYEPVRAALDGGVSGSRQGPTQR